MSQDINKVIKKLPDGFAATADSAQDDELKKMICQCEANIYTIDQAKEADEGLNKAREEVKNAAAPYRDAKSVQKAKITYMLYTLEERGHNLERL